MRGCLEGPERSDEFWRNPSRLLLRPEHDPPDAQTDLELGPFLPVALSEIFACLPASNLEIFLFGLEAVVQGLSGLGPLRTAQRPSRIFVVPFRGTSPGFDAALNPFEECRIRVSGVGQCLGRWPVRTEPLFQLCLAALASEL